jgi:hypothetical protein
MVSRSVAQPPRISGEVSRWPSRKVAASLGRSPPLNWRGAWKEERKVFPLLLGACAKRLRPHVSSSLRFFSGRVGLALSRHGAREKIVHALLWFHARIEFVDGNFEDASKIQLLEVTDMHQPAFNFGYLAAINVPTGELQPRC